MQPLRFYINVTIDGCVDHREGTPTEATHQHAANAIARADALILGRVTYQMMEEAWRPPASDAMPDWTRPFARTIDAARKYVVSNTLSAVDWNASLLRGDVFAEVSELKRMPGRGLFVGGHALATQLAARGLIDEFELVVHPLVAGHGPYLFAGLPQPLNIELVDRESLGDGIEARRYKAVERSVPAL